MYDVAADDTNLIAKSKITANDFHIYDNRYREHGFKMEVFVNVRKYEDKKNHHKSF